MYLDAAGKPTRDSIEGWRSSGVPGTVRGFELAQQKYGKQEMGGRDGARDRAGIEGISGQLFAGRIAEGREESRGATKNPSASSRRTASSTSVDETFKQPELAATLERIAKNGAKEFYEGETAQKLAAAMAKNGGLITLADLKNYAAVERKPLTGKYRELRNDHRASAQFRRRRDSANDGDAGRLGL